MQPQSLVNGLGCLADDDWPQKVHTAAERIQCLCNICAGTAMMHTHTQLRKQASMEKTMPCSTSVDAATSAGFEGLGGSRLTFVTVRSGRRWTTPATRLAASGKIR